MLIGAAAGSPPQFRRRSRHRSQCAHRLPACTVGPRSLEGSVHAGLLSRSAGTAACGSRARCRHCTLRTLREARCAPLRRRHPDANAVSRGGCEVVLVLLRGACNVGRALARSCLRLLAACPPHGHIRARPAAAAFTTVQRRRSFQPFGSIQKLASSSLGNQITASRARSSPGCRWALQRRMDGGSASRQPSAASGMSGVPQGGPALRARGPDACSSSAREQREAARFAAMRAAGRCCGCGPAAALCAAASGPG